ncbi:uncharacterized protein LOC132186486 [Corylus avellana]|uniref:uncharacterized protein LOC132186486 n=1 Tax=Corylus avellana TaxID=13451 RepID=UPI00286A96F7|nr:uncharacterized protein LOC132186486 [Corylus avellana]
MEGIKECDSNVEEKGAVSTSPSVSGSSDNGVPKAISVQGRITGPTRRSTKGGWTREEDKILAIAVKEFNGKNWKKIAKRVHGRTDVQCLHRWQKVLDPSLVKGPWSKEEDDLTMKLVAKKGKHKWSEIAKSLPGRIGKQCRERWHNHLNPDIKKTAWTEEEELILIRSHQIYGNKWAEIAKSLHGRTENSIKNHWNCSVRKKAESKEIKRSLDQKVNLKGSAYTCSPETIFDADNASTSSGPSVGQCQESDNNYKGNTFRESHNTDNSGGKRNSKSPVSFCTPPSHNKGASTVECSSAESILRSAARSFNNTPSIIRKRRLQCSRKIDNANDHNDIVCSQEEIIRENFDINSPHLLHLRPCDDRCDINSIVVVTNEKQLFLSPSKSQKLQTDIKKTAWTEEEELILIRSHQIYGNKWAEIAKSLHGRTENSIKNHWNCSVRKKAESKEIKRSLDQKVNLKGSAYTCSPETIFDADNASTSSGPSVGQCQESDNNYKGNTFRESHNTDNSGGKRNSKSPVSFCTPPSHNKGASTVEYSSAESILRSAARSFNNTPSIIRKRRLQCSRKIDNANDHNDIVCSQEEIIRENFDINSPHLLHLRPCDDRCDINSIVVVTNEKQLFLSPSKSQKLQTGSK